MVNTPPVRWGLTAIEITIDLELPQPFESSPFGVCEACEPRVSLVVAFALTLQLKRIISAVDRTIPARLPSRLRIGPPKARAANNSSAASIAPMLPLLRLQSRLIRAIEPGLAPSIALISFGKPRGMDDQTTHFIRDFISSKALPTLTPPCMTHDFEAMRLRTAGITLYRLSRRGTPQTALEHWSPEQSALTRLPLRSTP
jgi:hypothetical protein